MTILVTGATGLVGSHVLHRLAGQGAPVRALSRKPETVRFPDGVSAVKGDMLDVASMRAALAGVTTLFLLNTVSPTELTEAILTLNLARQVGVTGIVYLSAFNAGRFTDVPHFAAKAAVERMIADAAIPATILRANCFMQNDRQLMDALLGQGSYPFPIGRAGVSMVDVRDIAEVAATTLLARERAAARLPAETIQLVGPHALTGESAAAIWSGVLGQPIRYGGDDLAQFEAVMSTRAPNWLAMDMRLMLARFQQNGMVATISDVEALTHRLGRSPRTYAAFAAEITQHRSGNRA